MTFITDNHPPRLPPLHAYPQHLDKVLAKPTKPMMLRARIAAILGKIGAKREIVVDKAPKAP